MMTQAQESKITKVKEAWALLNENERSLLIPILLETTAEWKAWSLSDATKLEWLARQFREVGLPFYSPLP